MATVNALLAALHDRTLEPSAQPSMPSTTEMSGLSRLVRNAIRILALIDPPPDVMTILQAMPKAEPAEEPVNTPITTIGYTLGVLADTLNANPETVRNTGHSDRGQLRSQVLATLHHVATLSLAASPPDQGFSSPALIRDLADATRTATYVPRADLHEPIGQLALGQSPGSLDQTVARWAETAIEILHSQTRVTSYAFQRTAATIATICSTAAATYAEPTGERSFEGAASAALTTASQAWQHAADWPPEVRLGGRTTELRHRSQDLDQALATHRLGQPDAPWQQTAMSAALLAAERVAACHKSALLQVISSRHLWINVAASARTTSPTIPEPAAPTGYPTPELAPARCCSTPAHRPGQPWKPHSTSSTTRLRPAQRQRPARDRDGRQSQARTDPDAPDRPQP